MDREVRYRLFRIILVIFIFLCFTFLRESVGESYVEAREVESFLSKPLVMEQVATLESKINTDSKYYSYSIKITNEAAIFRSGDIIFSSDGDFGKVKYQILKDDTVVKTGVLKNNHVYINNCYIMHFDANYVRKNELDPHALFIISDCFYNCIML